MRLSFQPGSLNTSFTTKCSTLWYRKRSMSTGEEEFTPASSIAENVNFTATTEPGAGKMKILTVSCANPAVALV